MTTRPPIAAAWLLALTGCTSDTGVSFLLPELALLPEALEFEQVVSDQDVATLPLFVENTGAATLEATFTVAGADAAAFSIDTDQLELLPDESATIQATFTPDALRDFAAEIAVTSNDPDRETTSVPLTGTGRLPLVADISVEPGLTLDFGTVPLGSDKSLVVTILNLGEADLAIGSVRQTGAGAFQLQTDPTGSLVAPGGSDALFVTFTAFQDGGDSGTLVFPSNDPDEPEVEVEMVANGGGAFEYPEAVIDCPGQVNVTGPLVVSLDGSSSSDPDGRPLSFAWSMVQRPDAGDPEAAPTPDDQALSSLAIDAAGLWEVELQVTNDLGIPSVPTRCAIEAIPIDDVYIELTWGGPTSDLDLHLAQESAELFDVPGDTSWCNRAPDWGAAGDASDDPLLALDDDDGLGPEIITLTAPADGVYVVRVHNFDDGDDGSTLAEVQVFTGGALEWTGSKVLSRNEVWDVGQINWPTANFGAYSADPWDAGGNRECK
ncbi:MAG: choice-of-anchor D domain-containing protein [Myxococcales bacterium]|nr:choice-of-anchor D domain-containing protein [Myxococcales bacterium]